MTNSRLPWVLKGGDFSHPGWHTHPTAAYQMMFEFLRLSPSYELARIARTRKLSKLERSSVPKDFDQVLKTYDMVGDVNCVLFRQWWLSRGLHIFGNPFTKPKLREISFFPNGQETDVTLINEKIKSDLVDARQSEGLSAALLISVPVGIKRSEILKQFKSLIDHHRSFDIGTTQQAKIKLMGKRFHSNAMFKGLRLLWFKAAKPNWELWRLGAKSGISASYSNVLDPKGPRKTSSSIEIDDRIILSKITFRALERFELIAENAARGRFPCAEPIDSLDFNYPFLAQRLQQHSKWVKNTKSEWIKNN